MYEKSTADEANKRESHLKFGLNAIVIAESSSCFLVYMSIFKLQLPLGI